MRFPGRRGPGGPEGSDARPTRGTGILESLLARIRMRAALAALPPPAPSQAILDIGCGSRPWFLLRTSFDRRVGLDQVAPAEGAWPAGTEMIRATLAGEMRLPFPDAAFACVTCLAVLEHLEPAGLPSLFAEMRRVLNPGGRLVLTTPHAASDPVLRALARLGLLSREEIDEHQVLFRRRDLLALLRNARFPEAGIRVRGFLWGWNILALADNG